MSADILTIANHDRNIFQGKYIYPVVSRRAGGLSLGINLNTNNACNWQCIYCEIPNLIRGKPEAIDLLKLVLMPSPVPLPSIIEFSNKKEP